METATSRPTLAPKRFIFREFIDCPLSTMVPCITPFPWGVSECVPMTDKFLEEVLPWSLDLRQERAATSDQRSLGGQILVSREGGTPVVAQGLGAAPKSRWAWVSNADMMGPAARIMA